MAMAYATVTGRIVVPGTTTGIPGKVQATPLTEGGVLAFPSEDYTTVGPAVADVDPDGTLNPSLLIPTDVPAGTLWRLVFHPKGKEKLPVHLGDYAITASADIADLVQVDVTAITATIAADIAGAQAYAAAAAASAAEAEALVISDLGTTDGQTRALIEAPASQTATAMAAAIATTQPRVPLLGKKIKGGNVVLKPGGTWPRLWSEWDWDNWIKPQVDRAAVLGFNAIRLIGAPRVIFDDPGGGFSTLTQAQYDERWAQLATYCAQNGLSLYPGLCEKWDFYDLAPGSENYQDPGLTGSIVTTAEVLSAFGNVIGFDLFQEGDARTGSAWAQSTAYGSVGQHVNNGGRSYAVVTPGTSAASGTGPTGTGSSITDGTVVWAYDGIPVLVADVLALMAAIREVSSVPLTMSFAPYGNNIPWHDTDYMWYLVYADTAGADFIDVHLYSSDVVASDLDFLTQRVGKPVLIGEYGIAQDATAPDQTARMGAVAAVHNRAGVIGSFVWALADQSTTDSGMFGVWDNTGYVLGSAPLSTTTGKRTALTDVLPEFRVADPLPAQRPANLLDPLHARPRNTISASWSASSNTALVADPRGLGFKSTAAGDITLTIRATDRVFYTVAPGTWYRFKATLMADTAGRNCEAWINWTDAAGATLSTSLLATGTDSTRTPVTLDIVAKSHASAVRAQLIVRVLGTAAANELHVLMDADLSPV